MPPEHLCRIRNICDALVAAGFNTLAKQAKVLGLPRSTTWSILRGNHKKSGISAILHADVEIASASPRCPGEDH